MKILTLSGGTIGEVSTLLTRAASKAIDDSSERITSTTFESCGYIALLSDVGSLWANALG